MLTPSLHISPPPWMTAPETRTVMEALADGKEPAALFVGGCVRNAVIGAPAGDVDIATVWTPPEIIARLEAAGIKTVPTGVEHGTVTAVTGKKSFEITTLRRDVETDGRRAVVAFTRDWSEDAQRRDFTMNTLLADGEGNVYDPTGSGVADLKAGKVVFVGDAAQRIAEDYLRILRFFRFHAVYGKGAPDKGGLAACRAAAEKIPSLSRERITQEFLKILAVDEPVDILSLMFENNVLSDLPASGYDPVVLSALARLQGDHDAPDVMARLAAAAAFLPSHMERMEKYLILSSRDKKRFGQILDAVAGISDLSEKSIKKLIYHWKNEISLQAVLLFMAWQGDEEENVVRLIRSWTAPVLPVDGEDVQKAGVKPGPAVGQALKAVEAWWIANDFQPDRAACLKHLAPDKN